MKSNETSDNTIFWWILVNFGQAGLKSQKRRGNKENWNQKCAKSSKNCAVNQKNVEKKKSKRYEKTIENIWREPRKRERCKEKCKPNLKKKSGKKIEEAENVEQSSKGLNN